MVVIDPFLSMKVEKLNKNKESFIFINSSLKRKFHKRQVGFKWKVLPSVALIRSLAVDLFFVRQISRTKNNRHLGFGDATLRSDTK